MGTIFLKAILSLLLWIIGIIVGYILTKTKIRISQFKAFDWKPWTCTTCLTTWILFAMSLFTYFALTKLSGVILFVLTIMTFVAMKINDNKNDEVQL